MLTAVDIFSKYGWMTHLKNKTGTEVASALQKLFKERKPENLWVEKARSATVNMYINSLTCIRPKTKRNLASLNVGIEP